MQLSETLVLVPEIIPLELRRVIILESFQYAIKIFPSQTCFFLCKISSFVIQLKRMTQSVMDLQRPECFEWLPD